MVVVWIKLLAVNWWEVLKFWIYFIRNVVHGGLGRDWCIPGVPIWEFAGILSRSVWASTCSVMLVGPSHPRWRRLPAGKFSQLANVCRQVIVSRECRFQRCSDLQLTGSDSRQPVLAGGRKAVPRIILRWPWARLSQLWVRDGVWFERIGKRYDLRN